MYKILALVLVSGKKKKKTKPILETGSDRFSENVRRSSTDFFVALCELKSKKKKVTAKEEI